MTQIHSENQKVKSFRSRSLTGMIFALMIGGGIFMGIRSCSSNISPDIANLALKTNGKTFLYSNLGSLNVQMSIDKNESPAAMAFVKVYKDDEEYFVEPKDMQSVIDLMSGNTALFEYEEKSYEGYVTSDTAVNYKSSLSYESTAKVGEQLSVHSVQLKNDADSMSIQWKFNPKTGENIAVSNCAVRSFWFQTNPSPGETVISSEDFLVVKLKALCKFYNCTFEYDPEAMVLYITK